MYFEYGDLTLQKVQLLLYARATNSSAAVFWLEEDLCDLASDYDLSLEELLIDILGEPEETLKPCPFCAGRPDPAGWLANDGATGPECEVCGATATSAEAWNTRAGAKG